LQSLQFTRDEIPLYIAPMIPPTPETVSCFPMSWRATRSALLEKSMPAQPWGSTPDALVRLTRMVSSSDCADFNTNAMRFHCIGSAATLYLESRRVADAAT